MGSEGTCELGIDLVKVELRLFNGEYKTRVRTPKVRIAGLKKIQDCFPFRTTLHLAPTCGGEASAGQPRSGLIQWRETIDQLIPAFYRGRN